MESSRSTGNLGKVAKVIKSVKRRFSVKRHFVPNLPFLENFSGSYFQLIFVIFTSM